MDGSAQILDCRYANEQKGPPTQRHAPQRDPTKEAHQAFSAVVLRLWLLDGLAEGRTAILIQLHHALADGAAALDSLIQLFEPKDVPGDSRPVLQPQPTKGSPPRAAEPTDPAPGVRRV